MSYAGNREENHRSAGATQQVQVVESSREQTSSPPPAHRRMRAPEKRARSCEADLNVGSSSGCSSSRFNPRRARETRLRTVSVQGSQHASLKNTNKHTKIFYYLTLTFTKSIPEVAEAFLLCFFLCKPTQFKLCLSLVTVA